MRLTKRVLHYQCNNTEVVGITTERIICNTLGIEFGTKRQVHCEESSYAELQQDIVETIGGIFRQMGTWKHLGHLNKECDFQLESGRTVSVKTNSQGDKVCPQNIGQPSLGTFNKYFKLELKSTDDLKDYFMKNMNILLVDYIRNVFVCDDTLFFMYSEGIVYKITRVNLLELDLTNWNVETTRSKETWKESNTIKVRNEVEALSLGEIQVHNNRNSIKFRFHLNVILRLIQYGVIRGLIVDKYKLNNNYVFKVANEKQK